MILTQEMLRDLAVTATTAARKAGAYITSSISENFNIEHKEGAPSPASEVVTEVDHHAQELILQELKSSIKMYDLGVLTEESQDNGSRFEKEQFWCIDPLDGTLPFTEKREGYAVSIALVSKAGESLIGIVYDPTEDLLYRAINGDGVTVNEKALLLPHSDTLHFVSDQSLRKNPIYADLVSHYTNKAQDHDLTFSEQKLSFGAVKSALSLLSLGKGIFCKPPKKAEGNGSIWDYAATACIFQELGLHATAFNGEKLELNQPSTYMNQLGIFFSTIPFLQ